MWIGRADLAVDLVAIELRHHDIEADEVWTMRLPELKSLAAIAGEKGGESIGSQARVEGIERD